MTGLAMPAPVVMALRPGSAAKAWIMFVEALPAKSEGRMTEMGEGVFFSLVSPARPVTTTSFS